MRVFVLVALIAVACSPTTAPTVRSASPSEAAIASATVTPSAAGASASATPTPSSPTAAPTATPTPTPRLTLPPAPAGASSIAGCAVFPANNIWNRDISSLPRHARSAAWLASTSAATVRLHPDFGGYPYGYQLQLVDRNTPRVGVSFSYADESDPGPYPLTASTPIEPGSDHHAFMLDTSSCTLYELFDVAWNGGRPTAGSGAIFDLRSNALRPAGWTSADAAGLPIIPGVLRYDEVASGAVNHAIRFTVRRSDRSYLWPARHQAGAASDPSLPPMGARFRLQAGIDLSRFSPQARVILTALQRYGLIVADNGSDWFFQGSTDSRWSDALLSELKSVPASWFEAVDESSLMISASSAQSR